MDNQNEQDSDGRDFNFDGFPPSTSGLNDHQPFQNTGWDNPVQNFNPSPFYNDVDGNSEADDDVDDEEEEEEDDDDFFEEELIVDEELRQAARDMSHISDDNLTALIAYNASYLELIESLIAKTDRAMDDNREAQEMIYQKLASKSSEDSGYSVAVKTYTKPYFKDKSGMIPPMNDEARELYSTHQLSTVLKEELLWREVDIHKLYTGVRDQLIAHLNLRLEARKTLLQDKIKNINATTTEEQIQGWKDEIVRIDRKIAYNEKLSDDELFKDDDYSKVSWTEISVRYFQSQRSPTACSMKWFNEQRPTINKGLWTSEEDAQLREASQLPWTNWKFVAHELGTNRTEYMCICRAKELELRGPFNEKTLWSNEEDEKLISIVYNFHNIDAVPWEKVAKLMGNGRNGMACRRRFNYSLQTNLHFGRWSQAEDMFLLDAVNRFGPFDWDRIASSVPCRSAPQCRSRWANVLDLKRNVQSFTPEEDEIILRAAALLGRGKWSEISKLLTDRTPADVRGRYRRFLARKIKGLPPYEEHTYRNSIWTHFSKRQDVLQRFQLYENSENETFKYQDALARRFGIGSNLLTPEGHFLSSDDAILQQRSMFGNFALYKSGVWKIRPTLEEYRNQRFTKFFEGIPKEVKKQFEEFKNELSERRHQRELLYAKAEKAGLVDELDKKLRAEDVQRIQVLMNERLEILPNDHDQLCRRRLPRVRIRRTLAKKRGKKIRPAHLKKVAKARTDDEMREKYKLIREMHLTPQIAEILDLDVEKITRLDGTTRRISDLVLMEDLDSNKYWVTARESLIMKCLMNLNQHSLMKSMFNYEKIWRKNAIPRTEKYFRQELTFAEVPAVYSGNQEETPPLDAFAILISNVMMPNRANLTGIKDYRNTCREICLTAASEYFDALDDQGNHVPYDPKEHQHLDIQLPSRITNSVDYLLLRSRMFKMFFFPMLLQYGHLSPEARLKIQQSIISQQIRRRNERIFKETNNPEYEVQSYENNDVVVGRVHSVGEAEIPKVFKRLATQSAQIDDTIESLVAKVTEPPPKRKRQYKKKPKPTLTDEDIFVPLAEPQEQKVPTDTPTDTLDDVIDLVASNNLTTVHPKPRSRGPKPKASNEIEMVALRPELAKNEATAKKLGAYQPRWVKSKQKEIQSQNPEGEKVLTLADLLYVRGRKKRALTGEYDRQHNEMVLNSIRPQLETNSPNDYDEDDTEVEANVSALRRIKNEITES